jgi:hypothetical protein
MAAYIRFAQPVPDRALRRALDSMQPVIDELGFKGLQQAHQLMFKVDEIAGATPEVTQTAGKVFSRHGEAEAGKLAPVLEQIKFDPDSILYRSTEYISWGWHLDRITRLLAPITGQLSDTVVFEKIGVEYLDRFWTDQADPAPLDQLLQRMSTLVASHIFDVPGMFHSHTGAYLGSDVQDLELQVVRVDAVDDDEGRRWINITTTWEHRYPSDLDKNADPAVVMDQAHTNLKDLLAQVITPQQAKKIYLLGD